MQNKVRKFFLFLLFFIISLEAKAHPHAFVSLKADWIATPSELTAIKMQWTFDRLSSSTVLYDLKQNQTDPTYRQKLIDLMIENIIENDYFTELSVESVQSKHEDQTKPESKKRLAFAQTVQNVSLNEDKLQLILQFTVPLAQAVPFAQKQFKMKVYEPSFYVDMTFPTQTDIQLSESMQVICSVRLLLPKEDKALEEYALSIDLDATPDPEFNLGSAFAQQVFVLCQ